MAVAITPVNRRVIAPEEARLELTARLQTVRAAEAAVEIYLGGLCAGLGLDRSTVIGYDDATNELILDELDESRRLGAVTAEGASEE